MTQTEHKEPPNKGDALGALKAALKAADCAMKDGDGDIAETAKDADVMEDADLAEAARLLRTLKDALLGRKDADIAEDADLAETAKDGDIMEDADLAEAARVLRTLKDALLGRKDADIAESAKSVGISEMAKSIGEAVAISLAKAGVIQTPAKPENELLAKFSELEARLKRIENQPAEPQAVAIPVERSHVLDPDTKKRYEGAVSTLAKQVSELNDKERENLAAEIIKMIQGR